MAGLYIHLPFCKSRCIYCAFYSTTQHERMDDYVTALCKEMELRSTPPSSFHIPHSTFHTPHSTFHIPHEILLNSWRSLRRPPCITPDAGIERY